MSSIRSQFTLNIPNCFCNLRASPAYSDEFGLLYECHYMHENPWLTSNGMLEQSEEAHEKGDSDTHDLENGISSSSQRSGSVDTQKPHPICGFHIHKDAWDSFFYKGPDSLHSELSVCPHFNFTFCAYFKTNNRYPKLHPPVPNCFCGLKVLMRSEKYGRLIFTCPNYLINGARPKCNWFLRANEVPFMRPPRAIHQLKKSDTNGLLESTVENLDADVHLQKQPLTSNTDQPTELNRNGDDGNGYRFNIHGTSQHKYSVGSSKDTGTNKRLWNDGNNNRSLEKIKGNPGYRDYEKTLLHPPHKKGSCNSIYSQTTVGNQHARNLQIELEKQTSRIKDLEKELDQSRNESRRQNSQISAEKEAERKLRQSCQKKNVELETSIMELTRKIQELQLQIEKGKEEKAMSNVKCRICFEETITHAMLPCHHFVLCGKCIQEVDKCCVCRKPKEGAIRIYFG